MRGPPRPRPPNNSGRRSTSAKDPDGRQSPLRRQRSPCDRCPAPVCDGEGAVFRSCRLSAARIRPPLAGREANWMSSSARSTTRRNATTSIATLIGRRASLQRAWDRFIQAHRGDWPSDALDRAKASRLHDANGDLRGAPGPRMQRLRKLRAQHHRTVDPESVAAADVALDKVAAVKATSWACRPRSRNTTSGTNS